MFQRTLVAVMDSKNLRTARRTAAAPMKRPPVSTKYVKARLEGSPTGKASWLELSYLRGGSRGAAGEDEHGGEAKQCTKALVQARTICGGQQRQENGMGKCIICTAQPAMRQWPCRSAAAVCLHQASVEQVAQAAAAWLSINSAGPTM